MTPAPGDALLYAVSSRQAMPWTAFKAAIDATFVPTESADEMRYIRSAAAMVGDSLGHWDSTPDGQGLRVTIAPPVLARLPWRGMPRAVLCGSRSPETIGELVAACRKRHAAAVNVVSQSALHLYAPSRVEVFAQIDGGLEAVASELRVPYAVEPPAWALAHDCRAVSEYVESLTWQPDDHLDWPRRDFIVQRLAFGSPIPGDAASGVRLSTFEHPQGWTRHYRVYRDGEFAEVDRSMGRFVALASAGVQVMHYERRAGTVTVPQQLPLPYLAARALTLCSGQPPTAVPSHGIGERRYRDVPASVFDTIATRLGQQPSV